MADLPDLPVHMSDQVKEDPLIISSHSIASFLRHQQITALKGAID